MTAPASSPRPSLPGGHPFSLEERLAKVLDAADPLAAYRREFVLPGAGRVYLLGNSLGPMPQGVPEEIGRLLEEWGRHGVEGFTEGNPAWMRYADELGERLSHVVGAHADEVVAMNTLSVNIQLMLASFYRPSGRRRKVVMEEKAFPSDVYAVRSHLGLRGADPEADLVWARPRAGETALRTEDVTGLIGERRDQVALVFLGGVNYFSGQWFDLERITRAAHDAGALAGFDLAHAAGNVPLSLHDWGTDFAVWCSYKYLNAGPGAIGGAFVHERHAGDPAVPRLAGWWGNAEATRFAMRPAFDPAGGAAGWQLSTPPLLSLAPLQLSLDLFERAGMAALRHKSMALTAYLESLLSTIPESGLTVITPVETGSRGCQLSLRVARDARGVHQRLRQAGVVTDFRAPDVMRMAPAPLFNTFHEIWRAARAVRDAVAATSASPGRTT